MTDLSAEQQNDVIKAMSAVANAWESNTPYTEDEMCTHLEEITKVIDGKNDFYDFLIATAFNIKEHLWLN